MTWRRPLVAGNWKMHGTIAEARALIAALRAETLPEGIDVVVCPPFTALAAVANDLAGSTLALGAQTMNEHASGAYTGDISPVMLCEIGVAYVILGHSERRAACAETDETINAKVHAALTHRLVPIVAVGETLEEHRAGQAIAKVTRQTRAAFDGVGAPELARCVVAYEPIWAIGTGLGDDPENANRTMGAIRDAVEGLEGARLLYGGSLKRENAAALMAQPNIDGGLVGGASLDAASFAAIVRCARTRTAA